MHVALVRANLQEIRGDDEARAIYEYDSYRSRLIRSNVFSAGNPSRTLEWRAVAMHGVMCARQDPTGASKHHSRQKLCALGYHAACHGARRHVHCCVPCHLFAASDLAVGATT